MSVDWSSINLKNEGGLKTLNDFLSRASYITGYTASQDDVTIANKVGVNPDKAKYVHASRWFKHINYFTEQQKKTWPKGKLAGAKVEEEEIDLFGDTTEEDKSAAKKATSEKAKSAKDSKKVVIGKSTLVFEIKPASEKTNLDMVEKEVRKITIEGLEWSSAAKKIPLAYGLFKLQMGAVIIDDLVQTDSILEQIECIGLTEEEAAKKLAARNAEDEDEEEYEEGDDDEEELGLVQSAEIISFQKI